MRVRSTASALFVLSLLAAPAWAQDAQAPPPDSSRTDLFIGFGGESRLGDGDAGWRSAFRFSVDVNFTDRIALVVVPAPSMALSRRRMAWCPPRRQAVGRRS
jgi:hypothetical protein